MLKEVLKILEDDARTTPKQIATMTGQNAGSGWFQAKELNFTAAGGNPNDELGSFQGLGAYRIVNGITDTTGIAHFFPAKGYFLRTKPAEPIFFWH